MMTNGHVGFFQAQALHGIFARNKKEIQEIEKSHNAFTNLQDKSLAIISFIIWTCDFGETVEKFRFLSLFSDRQKQ